MSKMYILGNRRLIGILSQKVVISNEHTIEVPELLSGTHDEAFNTRNKILVLNGGSGLRSRVCPNVHESRTQEDRLRILKALRVFSQHHTQLTFQEGSLVARD